MELHIESPNGMIDFECEDTLASAWVSTDILKGQTYPVLPFVDDVQIVLDIGGNCGAAAVHFAHHYPDAHVHTFEPGSFQRGYLERNTAALDNVTVHPVGLYSEDTELPLYAGDGDSGMSSIVRGEWNTDAHEIVQLRSATNWLRENDVSRADVVKLDVEGVEPDVLRSLAPVLSTVQVMYIEYDSRVARREMDMMLADTHELWGGKFFLDQGEVVYVSKAVADDPRGADYLKTLFTAPS